MARIDWVNDGDATGQNAEIYGAWRQKNPHRKSFPEILKCFSHRPDVLQSVMDISYGMHFRDGHLTVRQKEMLATYVSALNECHY